MQLWAHRIREANEDFWMLKDGYIERLGDSIEKLRQTVMNYFNQCVTKYNKQLRPEFPSRYAPGNAVNDEGEGANTQLIDVAPGGKVIEDDEDESNKRIDVVSPPTFATYNCEIAIHKKISKQYRQRKQ